MLETENNTLENILEVAKAEFMEKGYQQASLRNIAKKAGVTTGAFYGYFKNKEEIFDALVGPQYMYLMYMYQQNLEKLVKLPYANNPEEMRIMVTKAVQDMLEYIYQNFESFKLILCSSEGTKYNNIIHEMAVLDVKATHDFARNTAEKGIDLKNVNPKLEHMLTSGMFSTFFELIIHDVPKAEAEEYTKQLFDFYSAGWAKIMGF